MKVCVAKEDQRMFVISISEVSLYVCCDCNSDSVLQIGFALQAKNKVKGSRTPTWLHKIILCKFICIMIYSMATKAACTVCAVKAQ